MIFFLLCVPGAYLIPKPSVAVLTAEWWLKEGGTYFKVGKMILVKFQTDHFMFPNNNK